MSIHDCKNFIRSVKANPENFYIIHYSCQNLNDNNDGLSPRITSIAITHYATAQTVSFSIHSIAEELHISREEVQEKLDDIEKNLLEKFYRFVLDRRARCWVHWNMRNITYGFEHLEHRYRVFFQSDAPSIPVERRLNLNDLLENRYGYDYAKHTRMRSLMELNGGIKPYFLSVEEEVQAFQKGEYMRVHNSVLGKVGFFHSIITKLLSGKVRTSSYGWGVRLDRLFESRCMKFIGLIAMVLTISVSIYQVFLWIYPYLHDK